MHTQQSVRFSKQRKQLARFEYIDLIRAPIAVFFHPDLFFSSVSNCLGLIMKNPVKPVFLEYEFGN